MNRLLAGYLLALIAVSGCAGVGQQVQAGRLAEVAKDNATVKQAGFIDLGSLKGNKGDQNYDLPADADLTKYKSVSIWCARFGVNFGAASLGSQKS